MSTTQLPAPPFHAPPEAPKQKRRWPWVVGAFILAAVIFNPSEEAPETTAEPVREVAEAPAEPVERADIRTGPVGGDDPEPEPAEPEPAEPVIGASINRMQYAQEILPIATQYSDLMGELSTSATVDGESLTAGVLPDASKYQRMANRGQDLLSQLHAIDPPAEAEESHDLLLEACGDIQRALDLMYAGINTFDVELVTEAGTHLSIGTSKLDRVTAMTNELLGN